MAEPVQDPFNAAPVPQPMQRELPPRPMPRDSQRVTRMLGERDVNTVTAMKFQRVPQDVLDALPSVSAGGIVNPFHDANISKSSTSLIIGFENETDWTPTVGEDDAELNAALGFQFEPEDGPIGELPSVSLQETRIPKEPTSPARRGWRHALEAAAEADGGPEADDVLHDVDASVEEDAGSVEGVDPIPAAADGPDEDSTEPDDEDSWEDVDDDWEDIDDDDEGDDGGVGGSEWFLRGLGERSDSPPDDASASMSGVDVSPRHALLGALDQAVPVDETMVSWLWPLADRAAAALKVAKAAEKAGAAEDSSKITAVGSAVQLELDAAPSPDDEAETIVEPPTPQTADGGRGSLWTTRQPDESAILRAQLKRRIARARSSVVLKAVNPERSGIRAVPRAVAALSSRLPLAQLVITVIFAALAFAAAGSTAAALAFAGSLLLILRGCSWSTLATVQGVLMLCVAGVRIAV
jgi:hypothetical protein